METQFLADFHVERLPASYRPDAAIPARLVDGWYTGRGTGNGEMPNITDKWIKTLAGTRAGYLWDDRLKGFAVRILADGTVSYYLKYRTPTRKQRWHCIGPASLLACGAARARAEEILAAARLGRDLLGEQRVISVEPTVADLASKHQSLHRPPQISEGTFKNYEKAWRLHILPLLGRKKVAAIGEEDIKALLTCVANPGYANGIVRCFHNALSSCERWAPPWRPRGSNPVRHLRMNHETPRDRILSRDELRRFMSAMESMRPVVRSDCIDLFKLLLLTGAREREICKAEWSQVEWDFKGLKLRKTKNRTQRMVNMGDEGIAILRTLQVAQVRGGGLSRWIFPARHGRGPILYPHWAWYKVMSEAGIEDFRIHDLRHTAASYAHAFAGFSSRDVQDMLGHSDQSSTSRYLNLTDELRADGAERRNQAILKLAR